MEMKIICCLMLISGITIAGEQTVISFATIESTDAARACLHNSGIESFMSEAWTNNVVAPRIHSLFWVEHLPNEKQSQAQLEMAYRDFGLEIATQLDNLAIELQTRTKKIANREMLGWLLQFAKWVRSPGGYENYRMSRHAEGLAVVMLARIVADPNEEITDFNKYIKSFLQDRESAILRADILFEESFGVFDVRSDAASFKNEGDFEIQWCARWRKPFKRFGGMKMEAYTENKQMFAKEDISLSFFANDSGLPSPQSISNNWGCKLHRSLIFGGLYIKIDPVISMYTFRTVIGSFPVPPKSDNMLRAYHDYYSDLWLPHEEKYGIIGGPAGNCYWSVINDEFMDSETRELINYRKQHPDIK